MRPPRGPTSRRSVRAVVKAAGTAAGAAGCARSAAQPALDAWAQHVARALAKFAQQRVVLVFVVVELLVAIATCCFFWRHHQVSHLGFGLLPSRIYFLAALFRACCASFGLLAVARRSPVLLRTYYCLFLVNAFFGAVCLVPILRLDCDCSSWKQCEALQAFETTDSPLLISISEPSAPAQQAARKVPYQDPPLTPERAALVQRPAAASLAQRPTVGDGNASSGVASRSASTRLRTQEAVGVGAQGRLLGKRRLGRRRRAHGDGGALELGSGEAVEAAAQPAEAAAEPPALPAKAAAAALPADAPPSGNASAAAAEPRRLSARWAAALLGGEALLSGSPRPPLQLFNVSSEGLSWASARPPRCRGRRLSEDEAQRMRRRWGRLKEAGRGGAQAQDIEIDTELGSQLWHCMVNHRCGVVSAEILDGGRGPRASFCELEEQVTPVVSRSSADADEAAEDRAALQNASARNGSSLPSGNETLVASIYFQRNRGVMHEDAKAADEVMGLFYRDVFAGSTAYEGMELLSSMLEGECRCSGKFPTCRTYHDKFQQKNRYWCSVSEAMRDVCLQRGVTVLWDEKRELMWTEELCGAPCECSGVGMVPPNGTGGNPEEGVDAALLWENSINYGSECRRWKRTDKWPWCYVGWDSTCTDREQGRPVDLASRGRHLVVPGQYRSSLPCNELQQRAAVRAATARCTNTSEVVEAVLVLMAMLCFPATVVLFKFLSNRCGDDLKVEQHFEVVLEGEASEEAEAWEDGEGAARRGSRSSSPTLGSAFAIAGVAEAGTSTSSSAGAGRRQG